MEELIDRLAEDSVVTLTEVVELVAYAADSVFMRIKHVESQGWANTVLTNKANRDIKKFIDISELEPVELMSAITRVIEKDPSNVIAYELLDIVSDKRWK